MTINEKATRRVVATMQAMSRRDRLVWKGIHRDVMRRQSLRHVLARASRVAYSEAR